MFISKQRPIAISQSEHQKLAGTLALLWGNADFERPSVPFDSFLIGIGLHDRAYGPLDNLPLGAIPEDEWLALTHSGFERRTSKGIMWRATAWWSRSAVCPMSNRSRAWPCLAFARL